jgi:hypothetical protein
MENLSWWFVVVSVQNVAEWVIVGGWKSETLLFCDKSMQRYWRTGRVSLSVTWFTDGTHFHLVSYVNKQNIRFWSSDNPRPTVANRLYPEVVRLWSALFSDGTQSPVFNYGTVTECCLPRCAKWLICSIFWYDMAFQWIKACLNKMESHKP